MTARATNSREKTHNTKHLLSETMRGFPPTKLMDRLCSFRTHSTSPLATQRVTHGAMI